MPDQTVTDLEAQLAAARAAAAETPSPAADPAATPVKDALAAKPIEANPHDFLARLSAVVDELVDAGVVSAGDHITAGKEADTLASLVKLIGEILKELPGAKAAPFGGVPSGGIPPAAG